MSWLLRFSVNRKLMWEVINLKLCWTTLTLFFFFLFSLCLWREPNDKKEKKKGNFRAIIYVFQKIFSFLFAFLSYFLQKMPNFLILNSCYYGKTFFEHHKILHRLFFWRRVRGGFGDGVLTRTKSWKYWMKCVRSSCAYSHRVAINHSAFGLAA